MFKEVRYPAKHIRQTIIREKNLEINISLTAMDWLNFTDQNSHLLFQWEMRRIVMICFLCLLGRIECSISIGRRRTALESKSSAGHFDWYCNNSQYFYSEVLKAYTVWKQSNYLLEGLSCKLILDMSWSLEAKFCRNKAALDRTDPQWVLSPWIAKSEWNLSAYMCRFLKCLVYSMLLQRIDAHVELVK
jgi:hypothetical protein